MPTPAKTKRRERNEVRRAALKAKLAAIARARAGDTRAASHTSRLVERINSLPHPTTPGLPQPYVYTLVTLWQHAAATCAAFDRAAFDPPPQETNP